MTSLEFENYMLSLASTHKDILHSQNDKRFYRMSSLRAMEEVFSSLLTAKVPALGINDSVQTRIENNGADQFFSSSQFSFYVFGRSELLNTDKRIEQTLLCQEIAKDFIAKIIADHYECFANPDLIILRGLDTASFYMESITGLPDNLLSVAVSFTTKEPFDKFNDTTKWQ